MSPDELAHVDIVEMNALAKQGFSESGKPINAAEQVAEMKQMAESVRAYWGSTDSGGDRDRVCAMALLNAIRNVPPKSGIPIPLAYVSIGRQLGYPLHLAVTPEGKLRLFWASKDGGWLLDPFADEAVFYQEENTAASIEHPARMASSQQVHILSPSDEFSVFLSDRGQMMLQQKAKQPSYNDITEMATEDALLAFSQAHLWSPKCNDYIRPIRDIAQSLLGYEPVPEQIRQKLNYIQKVEPPPIKNLALEKLLEQSQTSPVEMDIAKMNLLCAQGLPGSEKVDIPAQLALLDTWASFLDFVIKRNYPRFKADEALYHHSEGIFKMITMINALKSPKGMNIHYDPTMKEIALAVEGDEEAMRKEFRSDAFAKDSKKMFLTGLLGPERVGTCASMPVLYVAVGRRLGFPVFLVECNGHLFARWDDGKGERFNVEGTGNANVFTDEHFMKWPLPIQQWEVDTGQFLKSLTPAEELSVFLGIRSGTLRANGRDSEALVTTMQGIRLRPHNIHHEAKLIESAQAVTGPFLPW